MRNLLRKMKKDQRGLTLVELLAVVVILAIVAAIAFVLIGNVIDNSKKDAHISNAKQLIASAKLYEANGGKLESGGSVSSADLQSADVLGTLIDPWEKKSEGYAGTVAKSSAGVYSVTLNDIKKHCEITEEEEDLMSKDRKAICGE